MNHAQRSRIRSVVVILATTVIVSYGGTDEPTYVDQWAGEWYINTQNGIAINQVTRDIARSVGTELQVTNRLMFDPNSLTWTFVFGGDYTVLLGMPLDSNGTFTLTNSVDGVFSVEETTYTMAVVNSRTDVSNDLQGFGSDLDEFLLDINRLALADALAGTGTWKMSGGSLALFAAGGITYGLSRP